MSVANFARLSLPSIVLALLSLSCGGGSSMTNTASNTPPATPPPGSSSPGTQRQEVDPRRLEAARAVLLPICTPQLPYLPQLRLRDSGWTKLR